MTTYTKPVDFITDQTEFVDILNAVNYLIQERDGDVATLDYITRNVNYNNTIKVRETISSSSKTIFDLPENDKYLAGRGDIIVFVDGDFRDDFTEVAKNSNPSLVRITFDSAILQNSEVIFIIPLLNLEGTLENAEEQTIIARDTTLAAALETSTNLDDFNTRYLGVKNSDPILDNNGNSLTIGCIYFNINIFKLKVFDGDNWFAIDVTAALQIANDLSDLNSPNLARINLGLGSAAVEDIGSAIGQALQIIDIDGNPGLPSLDGSNLSNVNASSIGGSSLQTIKELKDIKNYVINGDFRIAQRGDNFTNISSIYCIDRWVKATDSIIERNLYTNETALDTTGKKVYTTRMTLALGGDHSALFTILEDTNELLGQEVTLSFWVKSSNNQDFVFEAIKKFSDSNDIVQAIGVQRFTTSTNWEYKTHTFTIPDNTGIASTFLHNQLNFWQSVDSSVDPIRVDNLGQTTQTQWLEFAYIQLELGNTASPYVELRYDDSLRLCRKFYENSWWPGPKNVDTDSAAQKNAAYIRSNTTASNHNAVPVYFKEQKRDIPSITMFSARTAAEGKMYNLSTQTDIDAGAFVIGTNSFYFRNIATVPLNQQLVGHWEADAEIY